MDYRFHISIPSMLEAATSRTSYTTSTIHTTILLAFCQYQKLTPAASLEAMLNAYLSLTEAELVDQRNDLLAELKRLRTGVQLTSDSRGGAAFGRQRMTASQLRDDLILTTVALQAKNPDKYGKLVVETYSDFRNNGTDPVG